MSTVVVQLTAKRGSASEAATNLSNSSSAVRTTLLAANLCKGVPRECVGRVDHPWPVHYAYIKLRKVMDPLSLLFDPTPSELEAPPSSQVVRHQFNWSPPSHRTAMPSSM